jgi:hypothetical protein
VRAAQAVVVLIEVQHLETLELLRHLLDLLLLARLLLLHARIVPDDGWLESHACAASHEGDLPLDIVRHGGGV